MLVSMVLLIVLTWIWLSFITGLIQKHKIVAFDDKVGCFSLAKEVYVSWIFIFLRFAFFIVFLEVI